MEQTIGYFILISIMLLTFSLLLIVSLHQNYLLITGKLIDSGECNIFTNVVQIV